MEIKKRIYEQVDIIKHEETVISTKALNTINERLSLIMELINPTHSWLNSSYEQNFDELEAWIRQVLPTETEDET